MKPAIIDLKAGGTCTVAVMGKLTADIEALDGAHVVQHFDTALGAVSKALVPKIVGGRTSECFPAFVRVLVGLQVLLFLICLLDVVVVFGRENFTEIQQI
jgi:hypothetical protein